MLAVLQRCRWMHGSLRPLLRGAVVLVSAVALRADLPALRTNEPLVIDGRLDEKAWALATPTDDFVGPLQPDGSVLPTKTQTRVKVLWDDETIYLGFICDGPPGRSTLRERDGLLHTEEVVEVFLDFTNEGKEYVELQVSPTGVVADLFHQWPERPTYPATKIEENQRRTLHSERGWTLAGLKAATAMVGGDKTPSGWTAEIALPIANLFHEPHPGIRLNPAQTFRANFVHYRYDATVAGEKPILQQGTWNPVLEGRPHISPMAMGTIRLVSAQAASVWEKTWRDASRLLVQDASRAFETGQTATRESRFGRAVTLLNVQPRTEANVEAAAQSLTQLVQENGNDDAGMAARYYLGRIEQVHRFVAQPRLALGYYESLMHDHPQNLYAQMAGVKVCLLRLYPAENVAAAARLEAGEALADFFTLPETRRDYHLLMADAYVRFGGNEARLFAHLLAVEAAGHLVRSARADLFVRLADAAEKNARKDLAILYCRKFLAERTREARVALVEQRLAQLEANP